MSLLLQFLELRNELLHLREDGRTQFIAGLAMQRQFYDSVFELPGERFSLELVHWLISQAAAGELALSEVGGTPTLLS